MSGNARNVRLPMASALPLKKGRTSARPGGRVQAIYSSWPCVWKGRSVIAARIITLQMILESLYHAQHAPNDAHAGRGIPPKSHTNDDDAAFKLSLLHDDMRGRSRVLR